MKTFSWWIGIIGGLALVGIILQELEEYETRGVDEFLLARLVYVLLIVGGILILREISKIKFE